MYLFIYKRAGQEFSSETFKSANINSLQVKQFTSNGWLHESSDLGAGWGGFQNCQYERSSSPPSPIQLFLSKVLFVFAKKSYFSERLKSTHFEIIVMKIFY